MDLSPQSLARVVLLVSTEDRATATTLSRREQPRTVSYRVRGTERR
jgi:hypothetical protein